MADPNPAEGMGVRISCLLRFAEVAASAMGWSLVLRSATGCVCVCVCVCMCMCRRVIYEGWNFNSGNYLFTNDTK